MALITISPEAKHALDRYASYHNFPRLEAARRAPDGSYLLCLNEPIIDRIAAFARPGETISDALIRLFSIPTTSLQ